jgi:hypothetical protein
LIQFTNLSNPLAEQDCHPGGAAFSACFHWLRIPFFS